jgi:hypothetical protein
MLLGDKLSERPLTFLDHSDEGVEGYGANMRLEFRRFTCQISLMVLPRCLEGVGVQLLYETIQVRYETVKFAGQIFAKEDATRLQVRKHLLEGYDLLVCLVPPIVDEDIDRWDFRFETLPELAIALVSDEDLHRFVLEFLAPLVDVNTIDAAFRPKIVSPHGETAAGVNANLQNVDFLATELPEVAVINLAKGWVNRAETLFETKTSTVADADIQATAAAFAPTFSGHDGGAVGLPGLCGQGIGA